MITRRRASTWLADPGLHDGSERMMDVAGTLPEILAGCSVGIVPVNVEVGLAIEAHRQHPCPNTLYTVALACRPTVADMQRQMDYLAGLPDAAWHGVPHWEKHREATLAASRRSIAWSTECT